MSKCNAIITFVKCIPICYLVALSDELKIQSSIISLMSNESTLILDIMMIKIVILIFFLTREKDGSLQVIRKIFCPPSK